MYPTENNVYIPSLPDNQRPITIEEARSGRIVALSDDCSRATVEVKVGLTVSYCGCMVDPESGKILEFIPRPVNKFKSIGYAIGKMDTETE